MSQPFPFLGYALRHSGLTLNRSQVSQLNSSGRLFPGFQQELCIILLQFGCESRLSWL
jgi:hypothetical protein